MKKYRIVVAGRSLALGVPLFNATDPRGVLIRPEPFLSERDAYNAIKAYIAAVDLSVKTPTLAKYYGG
jgi:hypothetical protein